MYMDLLTCGYMHQYTCTGCVLSVLVYYYNEA